MNYVFLDISTDGVQPHRSSNYSYWPVVLFICNLPPTQRFKLRHILPSMFIPGSRALKKGASDLHSYLRPFYDDLSWMSLNEIAIERWDGQKIKCVVLPWRIKLDLEACKKLTMLTGYNGLSPCRMCLFQGVYCRTHHHYYFPDKSYQTNENGHISLQTHYDIDNLDIRNTENIIEQMESIHRCETRAEQEDEMKCFGFSSASINPFFRFETISSFFSFPIDHMHLLYQNIASFLLDTWINSPFEDLSVLSKKRRSMQSMPILCLVSEVSRPTCSDPNAA